MPSYNKAAIIGHLCRDVELKHLQSGTAVAEVTVAVNDKRKGANGETIEEVSFIDCTLWGRTAEIADQYTHKGSAVLIEGRLKQDKWEDKETGAKRSKLRIVAERLVLLGSKDDGHSPQQEHREPEHRDPPSQEVPASQVSTDGDIPF
jgi:single-strand DNA-binding protein